MADPRVSVGLPVFNGENYLDEAIASLVDQTFEDFEIVISDNGSNDRTQEICEGWAARDPRIRYYRSSENRGAGWNFRRVFELATGDLFRWAAHDDLVRPGYLAACVAALETHPAAVLAYPRADRINTEGGSIPVVYTDVDDPDRIKRLSAVMFDEVICLPVFGLIRSETLRRTGLMGSFDSSDRILLGELALHGTFTRVEEELFVSRVHPEASMRAYEDRFARGAWFDPAHDRITYMPNWRYNREWLRMMTRAGLTGSDRKRAYGLLLRWSKLKWRRLAFDPVRVVLEAIIAGSVRIIRHFQAYE